MKVQKYEISRTIDKLKSIVQKNDQFPALGGVLVKDGTVMEYSITASDIAKRIGCDRQDIYSSASYGLLIKKEYYVEITDRPLSWKKDIDLLTEYDNVRKKFLRRCGK